VSKKKKEEAAVRAALAAAARAVLHVEAVAAEPERTLRMQALDRTKGKRVEREEAIAILADFYEERGQSSRAALWREQLLPSSERRRHVLDEVPDLLTRPHLPQAADCRRNQMIWLLRTQGLSSRKTAAAFGLSSTRVEQIVAVEDRRIGMHARNEQLRPTLKATERLVAADALPGDRPTRYGYQEPWFELGAELPQDWPAVCDLERDKRRGK